VKIAGWHVPFALLTGQNCQHTRVLLYMCLNVVIYRCEREKDVAETFFFARGSIYFNTMLYIMWMTHLDLCHL